MLLAMVFVALMAAQTFEASPVIDGISRPQILRYESDTDSMPNSYKFSYDTSDGTSRAEQGAIIDQSPEKPALDVLGSVRWYDDKGQLYEMTYKAGKRGYRTIIKKVS